MPTVKFSKYSPIATPKKRKYHQCMVNKSIARRRLLKLKIGRTPRTLSKIDADVVKQLTTNYVVVDGCWIWSDNFFASGRPRLRRAYRSSFHERAHIASYQFYKGKILEGLYVCHTCDNIMCINPNHLWLGTNQENQLDAVKKGGRWLGNSHKENHA